MKLEQALQYCKFSRRYKGYRELLDCVKIAMEEENRPLYGECVKVLFFFIVSVIL